MATRLDSLSIEEVSGVDSPANETPGWLVMKAHDIDALERTSATLYAALAGADEFLESAPEEVVKARDTLEGFLTELLTEEPKRDTLVSKVRALFQKRHEATEASTAEPEVPAEEAAPEVVEPVAEVAKADDVLNPEDEYFDTEEEIDMDDYEAFGTDDEPVVKASELDSLRDVLSVVLDRMENIEKALAGPTALDGQEDRANAVVEKSSGGSIRDAIISASRGNRVTIQ